MSHRTVRVIDRGNGGEILFLPDAVTFIEQDESGRMFVSPAYNAVRVDELDGRVYVSELPYDASFYDEVDSESNLRRIPTAVATSLEVDPMRSSIRFEPAVDSDVRDTTRAGGESVARPAVGSDAMVEERD